MSNNPHYKEFVTAIRKASGRYDAYTIFRDFCELAALSLQNAVAYSDAFAALKAKGRTNSAIAAQFGVTELLVKKRLAIAGLIPPVLRAYQKDEIDAATLRTLTMASKAQQKQWYKLFRDPEEREPRGRWLKDWLFGGAQIPVTNALFPLGDYEGQIVSDLFSAERYFDDPAKFWKRQMEAVIHKQAAYLEAGWPDVHIGHPGKRFSPYDKVRRSKKDGGRVYISLEADGAVNCHEGWLEEKEAKRLDRAKAKSSQRFSSAASCVKWRPFPVVSLVMAKAFPASSGPYPLTNVMQNVNLLLNMKRYDIINLGGFRYERFRECYSAAAP